MSGYESDAAAPRTVSAYRTSAVATRKDLLNLHSGGLHRKDALMVLDGDNRTNDLWALPSPRGRRRRILRSDYVPRATFTISCGARAQQVLDAAVDAVVRSLRRDGFDRRARGCG